MGLFVSGYKLRKSISKCNNYSRICVSRFSVILKRIGFTLCPWGSKLSIQDKSISNTSNLYLISTYYRIEKRTMQDKFYLLQNCPDLPQVALLLVLTRFAQEGYIKRLKQTCSSRLWLLYALTKTTSRQILAFLALIFPPPSESYYFSWKRVLWQREPTGAECKTITSN